MSGAATIRIESAYPSDASGNPIQVELGESFYMTSRLAVDGALRGTYRVRFDLPYASRVTPALSYGGQARVTWGPYPALLADATRMTVTVDSSADQIAGPLTVSITPTPPVRGLEYFAPQALTGSIGAGAVMAKGSASGLQWYSPLPSTSGFQRLVGEAHWGAVVTSTPFSQPTIVQPRVDRVGYQFSTIASSCRANPEVLRTVGFDAYKSLPAGVGPWLKPEAKVESRSGEVSQFVAHTLPKNFRQTMRPYDVAQILFQGVVAHVEYETSPIAPDALAALRSGRGDCGYFAALFVASCRNVGIPARTVCGMTIGDNQWHVWSEFYVPGQDWIPADPAYCDGLCADGSLPLYFGTIPELDQRVAVTYGFDHVVGGRSIPILQSPAVAASGTTRVAKVTAWCSLSTASLP